MSVGRKLSLKDFRQYVKKLNKNLTGHEGAVVRGVHSGLYRAITVVQRAAEQAPPASPNGSVGAVNTGAYRQAWQVETTRYGGRIWNSKAYSGVIEYGRRAGSKAPPYREIELWARRKLGLSAEEAKRASYPIAKAIAKRGLSARKVLTSSRTESEILRVVMEEIKREVKEALKRGGNL